MKAEAVVPKREITLLQRSAGKSGAGLGKTTGWIHRMDLKRHGVQTITGLTYRLIDDQGLHIEKDGEERLLGVDSIIICAGQESLRTLEEPLRAAGLLVHLIGGAFEAGELDAKRAIAQASRLAADI
jgi:2,4-dienoyl-CoA reductase (NADPH2)